MWHSFQGPSVVVPGRSRIRWIVTQQTFRTMADISSFSDAELRALATRNLAECCDECRALLREQLEEEEFRED